jgi:hypothetical protein
VPPFTGVAVNVTEVPAHIRFDGEAAIVTVSIKVGLTVILNV